MSWNYRIVRAVEGVGPEGQGGNAHYGLYEVFYDEGGNPIARTEDPIAFGGYETSKELREALREAWDDSVTRPVMDDLDEWPGFGDE